MEENQIQPIIVPAGIRYVTEGDWYNLDHYPFPHILDKVLTGCGFTEYCLRNQQHLILCSPRRLLLQNKEDQHQGELYYFKNDLEQLVEYDTFLQSNSGSINSTKAVSGYSDFLRQKEKEEKEEEAKKAIQEKILFYKSKVKEYYESCRCEGGGKPCKIIVTYDSFRHVKEALIEWLGFERFCQEFQVVVDEWQSIFIDARFKPSTEIELVHHLANLNKVCFVSATPMIDKYLNLLDEFSRLPYYRFDWNTEESGRIIRPNISVFYNSSITECLYKVIQSYKNGKFEDYVYTDELGQFHKIVSNEAVLYVNSVKHICKAIKKMRLLPDQCNILCANTTDNLKKVRKAFIDVIKNLVSERKLPAPEAQKSLQELKTSLKIGSVPTKGQPHKMFTFCTRTVYLGADFYSTCARSFIFSDANIDSLSVDIALDLPQILGRQRLVENPWKNNATLYVKSTQKVLKPEVFENYLAKKRKETETCLNVWQNCINLGDYDGANVFVSKCMASIKTEHYSKDYISINNHAGSHQIPVFNKLIEISEMRAFEIQNQDYSDRVSVYNTITQNGIGYWKPDDYLNEFGKLHNFDEKLKFACEVSSVLTEEQYAIFLKTIPTVFSNYILNLGPERCAAFSYRNNSLEEELNRVLNNQEVVHDLRSAILREFKVGQRYRRAEIKETLRKLYAEYSYDQTPKAADLQNYFNIKTCSIIDPKTKKKDNGFIIVDIK